MQKNTHRRGARRRNSAVQSVKHPLAEQLDWDPPSYLHEPVTLLSSDQIEAIHHMSLRVLEEIGILFLNDDALKILDREGCDVDWSTKNVRFDRNFILEKIKKAPAHFTLTPRNKDKTIIWGGRHFSFGHVASAPNVMDLDNGRPVGDRKS